FTDGMRVGIEELRHRWRLPARALVLGLPLTLLGTAVLAHVVVGLPWLQSLLVGAALSPTDPVFAAAIVGREGVPRRLRHLLNVESGLNDGLALPIVLVLIAVAAPDQPSAGTALAQGAAGVALGVAVPVVALGIERLRWFSASSGYEPFLGLAIALVLLAVARATGANVFLAAFTGGVTFATISPPACAAFEPLGEQAAELLKLGALLVFGTLVSLPFLNDLGAGGYAFALLALLVARPLAIAVALWGTPVRGRERVAAAWFGPKGFASVVYGLLILDAGVPGGDEVFHLVGLVVTASIVAHSSTDVLVARWFDDPRPEPSVDRGA
ncbi:MAG: cation:proton antiporter, partial [Actinobacteria bacterium]|nr:cation:proton antiporter [Actinomycetota bacterium]